MTIAGRRRPGRLRRVLRRLAWVAVLLVGATVLQVAVLRFVDPPFSAFMAARQFEAWGAGDTGFRVAHDWRALEEIAPHVPLAVVAAEDQRFADHHGFDFEAIADARERHARGGKLRGASTISQQVAKNLFLWSGRSWVRKGIEAWYTLLIEALWPKSRILEVYVNVAEFGDGVYGAQAAARTWFGKDAAALSPSEAARLAAVLPSPKRYSVGAPGPYVRGRAAAIERQMRQIGGTAWLRRIE